MEQRRARALCWGGPAAAETQIRTSLTTYTQRICSEHVHVLVDLSQVSSGVHRQWMLSVSGDPRLVLDIKANSERKI